jgi:hypothetical protein
LPVVFLVIFISNSLVISPLFPTQPASQSVSLFACTIFWACTTATAPSKIHSPPFIHRCPWMAITYAHGVRGMDSQSMSNTTHACVMSCVVILTIGSPVSLPDEWPPPPLPSIIWCRIAVSPSQIPNPKTYVYFPFPQIFYPPPISPQADLPEKLVPF